VDNARDLYQKALGLDPTLIDAAANLGVIDARSGDLQSAVKLWQEAFERAPADSSIGMGPGSPHSASPAKIKHARSYVLRVLRSQPRSVLGPRKLLQNLNARSAGVGTKEKENGALCRSSGVCL